MKTSRTGAFHKEPVWLSTATNSIAIELNLNYKYGGIAPIALAMVSRKPKWYCAWGSNVVQEFLRSKKGPWYSIDTGRALKPGSKIATELEGELRKMMFSEFKNTSS